MTKSFSMISPAASAKVSLGRRGAELDRQRLLAGRQVEGRGAVARRGRPVGQREGHGGVAIGRLAFGRTRADHDCAGVEDEERLGGLARGDRHRLAGRGLADRGGDDVAAGLEVGADAAAVLGRHVLALRAVALARGRSPRPAEVRRAAGRRLRPAPRSAEIELGDRLGRRRGAGSVTGDGSSTCATVVVSASASAPASLGGEYLPPVFSARQATSWPSCVGQAEADHVGGEVDALRLRDRRRSGRVGIAGLDAVGDEDHRRLVLGVSERLGGLLHRFADRGLALGADRRCGVDDLLRGPGGGRHEQLDVAAVALLAVAVASNWRCCRRVRIAGVLEGEHDVGDGERQRAARAALARDARHHGSRRRDIAR